MDVREPRPPTIAEGTVRKGGQNLEYQIRPDQRPPDPPPMRPGAIVNVPRDAVVVGAAPERAGRDGDQPLPTPGQEEVFTDLLRTLETHPLLFDPKAVEMVRPLLEERQRTGIRRYGRSLQTFNGRDVHLDLVQELLDAVVYTHQAALERARLEADLALARADLASHVAALDGRIATLKAERDAARENFLAARDARDAAVTEQERLARELALEVAARKHLEERLGT